MAQKYYHFGSIFEDNRVFSPGTMWGQVLVQGKLMIRIYVMKSAFKDRFGVEAAAEVLSSSGLNNAWQGLVLNLCLLNVWMSDFARDIIQDISEFRSKSEDMDSRVISKWNFSLIWFRCWLEISKANNPRPCVCFLHLNVSQCKVQMAWFTLSSNNLNINIRSILYLHY